MASNTLIPIRMKKEDMDRADVQAFRCGSKSHETPLADWIKKHAADRIRGGCKVWLYRLEASDGPLVGYGSFANGKIGTQEADGSRGEILIYEIPMLALHEDYWGKPKGVDDPEEKFSRQIVRHLQGIAREAQTRGSREKRLCLYVHPNALEAQKLYEACGFAFAPGRFLTDKDIHPDDAPGLFEMDYDW